MKRILYIHGFMSSARSSTIVRMKKQWVDFEIVAFDVNHHPLESIDKIEQFVRNNNVDLLMGTSLGGYYVLAADANIPKLAVNPVINPTTSLDREEMLGIHEYFNERADGQQTVLVTREHLQEFIGIKFHLTDNTFIVGSTHDELLGNLTHAYQQLVGERFTPTDEIGHRINPQVTAVPDGLLYRKAKELTLNTNPLNQSETRTPL